LDYSKHDTGFDIRGISYAVAILPYMEDGVITDTYDFSDQAWLKVAFANDGEISQIRIGVYRCPSFYEDVNRPSRKDYFAVNGGRTADGTNDWGPVFRDGVFYIESDTRLSQIIDGTSHTMAVGEAIHYSLRGMGPGYGNPRIGGPADWFHGGHCYLNAAKTKCAPLTDYTARHLRSTKRPMNSTVYPIFQQFDHEIPMGSAHSGGAQFLLCDGHVEFLQDAMDMDTYQALSTRAGEEVVNEL
jgi:prepilin-type processing-associated H-X9-DG protein